jgi:hypothetical protein
MAFQISLVARGRIYNSDGKCNAPGNMIRGVRLMDYDEEREVLLIRGDPVNAPEAWFEIELPVKHIRSMLEEAEAKEEAEGERSDE